MRSTRDQLEPEEHGDKKGETYLQQYLHKHTPHSKDVTQNGLTSKPLPVAVHPTISGFSPSKISYSLDGKACGAPRFPNLGYFEIGVAEEAGTGGGAALFI